jgi:hypothetical protein
MGYIPTYNNQGTQDFQTAGMAEKDGRGQVFRYNNNGVNFSDDSYSEIAFRNNYGQIEGASIPIDSINIKSTGNILNSAGNNYSLQADSLNIGVGGADKSNAVITADAAGNLTIEAANAITLKVGRTTLSISNTSFSVESQIADSPISNSWDAGLSLSPRGGFSASGMNCKLNAVKKAVMSDGMGGMFSTTMGVGSIKGREIKLANYNAEEYKALNITADIEFTENMVALINGMEYQDKQRDLEKNAADQEIKVAAANDAAAAAKEAEKNAADAFERAEKASSDLKAAGASEAGYLRDLNTTITDALEAENRRHKAVEEAKSKRDEANKRQDALDKAETWGNTVNFIMEWAGFVKTLHETLQSLYEDWKQLSATREKAREMERKARLANLGLKDLSQKELENRAKAKAIEDYKKKNPAATDGEAEKHWEEMSKDDKDKMTAVEKKKNREETDAAYKNKLKEEIGNKANEDLAKDRYDALPDTPAKKAWADLPAEEREQLIDNVKNAQDEETKKAREKKTDEYIDSLEDKKEEEWKKPDIYKTGGISAPLPSDIPQPQNPPGQNP